MFVGPRATPVCLYISPWLPAYCRRYSNVCSYMLNFHYVVQLKVFRPLPTLPRKTLRYSEIYAMTGGILLVWQHLVNVNVLLKLYRYWLPAGCREAANCRYFFYSEAENQHFRPVGYNSLHRFVKFSTVQGHMGPLCRAKFHFNRCTGPIKSKVPLLVNILPAGTNPLTDLYKYWGFYAPNYPAWVF